jgi:hypothetical protein
VADGFEIEDTESAIEGSLEEPLSGISDSTEIDIAAVDVTVVAEEARTNPERFFFTPGCFRAARAGNTLSYAFAACESPYGVVNGTVVSTWRAIAGGYEVTHVTKGLQIAGARVDHEVTIGYTKEAGVYTRLRKVSTSGTTARGHAISHQASYVTAANASSGCNVRNGNSTGTLEGRAISRSLLDYERCGASFACALRGAIRMSRPPIELTVDFDGFTADIFIGGRRYVGSSARVCTTP